jgi:hypothetical protein
MSPEQQDGLMELVSCWIIYEKHMGVNHQDAVNEV